MPTIVLILCLFAASALGQAFTLRDMAFVGKIASPVSSSNLISYGGEVARVVMDSNNPLTNSITISNAIPQGSWIVVLITTSTTPKVTNVTDVAGNSYALDVVSEGSLRQYVASAKATTALASNDVIKVRFDSAAFSYRVFSVNLVTGQDATASWDSGKTNANVFNATVTCSGTTVANRTISFGILWETSYASTPYTPAWSWIGEVSTNSNGYGTAFVVKTNTSSGTLNLGGTLSGANTWYALWSAYK